MWGHRYTTPAAGKCCGYIIPWNKGWSGGELYFFVSIVMQIFKHLVLSEHFCFVLYTWLYTLHTNKHVSDKCQSHRNLPYSALHCHSAVSIPHDGLPFPLNCFHSTSYVFIVCAFPGCVKIIPCNFNSTCLCSNTQLWPLLRVCSGKNGGSEDTCDSGCVKV